MAFARAVALVLVAAACLSLPAPAGAQSQPAETYSGYGVRLQDRVVDNLTISDGIQVVLVNVTVRWTLVVERSYDVVLVNVTVGRGVFLRQDEWVRANGLRVTGLGGQSGLLSLERSKDVQIDRADVNWRTTVRDASDVRIARSTFRDTFCHWNADLAFSESTFLRPECHEPSQLGPYNQTATGRLLLQDQVVDDLYIAQKGPVELVRVRVNGQLTIKSSTVVFLEDVHVEKAAVLAYSNRIGARNLTVAGELLLHEVVDVNVHHGSVRGDLRIVSSTFGVLQEVAVGGQVHSTDSYKVGLYGSTPPPPQPVPSPGPRPNSTGGSTTYTSTGSGSDPRPADPEPGPPRTVRIHGPSGSPSNPGCARDDTRRDGPVAGGWEVPGVLDGKLVFPHAGCSATFEPRDHGISSSESVRVVHIRYEMTGYREGDVGELCGRFTFLGRTEGSSPRECRSWGEGHPLVDVPVSSLPPRNGTSFIMLTWEPDTATDNAQLEWFDVRVEPKCVLPEGCGSGALPSLPALPPLPPVPPLPPGPCATCPPIRAGTVAMTGNGTGFTFNAQLAGRLATLDVESQSAMARLRTSGAAGSVEVDSRFEKLIEFIDLDHNGAYDLGDLVVREVRMVDLPVAGLYQYPADPSHGRRIGRVDYALPQGGTVSLVFSASPGSAAQTKVDVEVHGYAYADPRSQLALQVRLASASDWTVEEGPTESRLSFHGPGVDGYFSWLNTAEADGLASNVTSRVLEEHRTTDGRRDLVLLLAYVRAANLVHDPAIGVADAALGSSANLGRPVAFGVSLLTTAALLVALGAASRRLGKG